MIEDGVADIGYPVPVYTPGRFPDNSITDVPGMFSSSTEASTILWGLHEEGLLPGFEDLKVLGLFGSPPFSAHSRQPINSLSDFAGLKVRAAG
jgi:TRAP-type C4-dicarboxylate transport system substrate-binding protein